MDFGLHFEVNFEKKAIKNDAENEQGFGQHLDGQCEKVRHRMGKSDTGWGNARGQFLLANRYASILSRPFMRYSLTRPARPEVARRIQSLRAFRRAGISGLEDWCTASFYNVGLVGLVCLVGLDWNWD
jgi:hypothetical protein